MTLRDLSAKDVIQLKTGENLGRIDDVVFDEHGGQLGGADGGRWAGRSAGRAGGPVPATLSSSRGCHRIRITEY